MSTAVPEAIQHLDFEVEEKQEPEKTCDVRIPHPVVKTDYSRCGRPAAYQVTVLLPCCANDKAKKAKMYYFCASCWRPTDSIQCAGHKESYTPLIDYVHSLTRL